MRLCEKESPKILTQSEQSFFAKVSSQGNLIAFDSNNASGATIISTDNEYIKKIYVGATKPQNRKIH
jgi:hypothetical protein